MKIKPESSTFKIVREKKMVAVDAAILHDGTLSLAARGVYAILASCPADATNGEAVNLLRDQVSALELDPLLTELAKAGHIERRGQ